MTNSTQYLRLSYLGCWNYLNMKEIFGNNKHGRTFKISDHSREFSLSNGWSKCIYRVEGNKLIHKQYGKKDITIVREFSHTHCIATYMVDKVIAKKYFVAYDEVYF